MKVTNTRSSGVSAVLVAAVVVASITGRANPAQGSPKAEISIEPAPGTLTVTLVAQSSGFPSGVETFMWTFGDGQSATTTTNSVTHTYPPKPSRFVAFVTEKGAGGISATASGVLKLTQCPVGTGSCTESLGNVRSISLLQVTGPISPNAVAGVDLFVGPYQIANCEPQISPAVAFTDSGFTGSLTVTLKYTTAHPAQVPTTCFASTVPFTDAAGKSVTSGALPSCQTAATAPCVNSITVMKSVVTKSLSVPASDPKVGAP